MNRRGFLSFLGIGALAPIAAAAAPRAAPIVIRRGVVGAVTTQGPLATLPAKMHLEKYAVIGREVGFSRPIGIALNSAKRGELVQVALNTDSLGPGEWTDRDITFERSPASVRSKFSRRRA